MLSGVTRQQPPTGQKGHLIKKFQSEHKTKKDQKKKKKALHRLMRLPASPMYDIGQL